MKNLKYLIIVISFIALGATESICQPGPPGGGGGPGGGGPPCWPPSTCETPINNELIFLLVAGLGLRVYFFKKEKKATT